MTNYTLPTSNDTIGFYEYFSYVNNTADGLFFPIMILVIFTVIFIATKQFSTSKAWTFASFTITMLSIPLAVLDLLASKFMYLSILMLAVGLLWLKLEVE